VAPVRLLENCACASHSDERFSQIEPDHAGANAAQLQTMRRWRSPESLLQPMGGALAKFVCEVDFSDVKAREGRTCMLVFADHTRGRAHSAAWPLPAIARKKAAHRQRLKPRH
jgi:predicted RNA-binding Zn ribbon-like protein